MDLGVGGAGVVVDGAVEVVVAGAGTGRVDAAPEAVTTTVGDAPELLDGDVEQLAGPLTHDDGETMIGSLLALDFPSRDAAQAWLTDEPCTRAGLYADVEVHAFANLWPQKAGFPPAG